MAKYSLKEVFKVRDYLDDFLAAEKIQWTPEVGSDYPSADIVVFDSERRKMNRNMNPRYEILACVARINYHGKCQGKKTVSVYSNVGDFVCEEHLKNFAKKLEQNGYSAHFEHCWD